MYLKKMAPVSDTLMATWPVLSVDGVWSSMSLKDKEF